ncbi:MAG: GPW/gp25 family protein [Pseudohongiella sp.]|uniref:GPW/gp25 family protein n=1 Tax=Pseudohongiella sp. TaxID=1979412 RepID=UPI00349FF565
MNAATGRTLAGTQHIGQSIGKILNTPLGSRVMRRDFGSVIPALIDQPLTPATVLRLYSAAVVAIQQWEPRVKVGSVNRNIGKSGEFILDISLTRADTGESDVVQIPLGGGQ